MADFFDKSIFSEITGSEESGGTFVALSIFSFILLIALMIMIQSALAGWWSRCYKFPLGVGFMIVLGTPIIALLISLVKFKKLKTSLFIILGLVKIIAIFYALYLQFLGRCNLGVYK